MERHIMIHVRKTAKCTLCSASQQERQDALINKVICKHQSMKWQSVPRDDGIHSAPLLLPHSSSSVSSVSFVSSPSSSSAPFSSSSPMARSPTASLVIHSSSPTATPEINSNITVIPNPTSLGKELRVGEKRPLILDCPPLPDPICYKDIKCILSEPHDTAVLHPLQFQFQFSSSFSDTVKQEEKRFSFHPKDNYENNSDDMFLLPHEKRNRSL
eukprot:TRINITY_DN2069_c0_g2_i1.p1 TRINITY_DN2069_c0_g2~~TRINITY_DN2069_c0_g2_i1.p1  ORF type:complete len:214 (+),score=55.99 TRINITY_DN2069_c0_g2_i1:184-825(+)